MSERAAFNWPVRVYYENTDAGGVVYHAEYLKFCERARTEWLRSQGFEQTELRTDHGIVFVVRSAEIQYLRPARFNDELVVLTNIGKLGRCAFEFDQEIRRGDEKLLTAHIGVVCVSSEGFRPKGIPEHIRIKIQEFL